MTAEILDAQLHPNLIAPHDRSLDSEQLVDVIVGAMNAAGVGGVLLNEYMGWDDGGRWLPGVDIADGVRQYLYPVSEVAVKRFPDRFAYTGSIDFRHPELEAQFAAVAATPNQLALRWAPFPITTAAALAGGADCATDDPEVHAACERYFALADRHRIPVFLTAEPETVARYAREFPNVWFILDHCGVNWLDYIANRPPEERRFDGLRKLLAVADVPNIAIKWCHAQMLSIQGYPYADVTAELRAVIDAFGPERIMWGSDHSVYVWNSYPGKPVVSWAQSMFYIRDSEVITAAEKEWIFDRSIQTILRWER